MMQGFNDLLQQIREETDTRIELSNDGNVFVITGTKENADKAKEKIESIQKSLVIINCLCKMGLGRGCMLTL